MAPFGNAFGGPLEDEEIDAIIAFMRTWEENPPVELPPEVVSSTLVLTGEDIYNGLCAQCHGQRGEGLIGPSLSDPLFQFRNSDSDIFESMSEGHAATSMIAWGEILTSEQISQVVEFIRLLPEEGGDDECDPTGVTTFNNDVLPIFEVKCTSCHGSLGGWDGSTYEGVITTGNNAPVVIQGDAEGSLLAQKLLGTHTEGTIMPPAGMLPESEIQVILDWINEGALEKVECETLAAPSFSADLQPILDTQCVACHGALGGWDGATYEGVMTTGNNAPVVIPGDAENSLLVQKLLGTHTEGTIMPPAGMLPESDIQLFVDWVNAGAQDD
jgi:mono/diheme cytochrome c family protein